MSIVDDSYNNLISAYKKLISSIKDGIDKHDQDALSKIKRLPADPNHLTQAKVDEMKELADLAISRAEKNIELIQRDKEVLSKDIKVGMEIFNEMLVKKKTKPKGPSQSTLIRNQEIVDKCYELEKQDIKSRTIYETIAKDYPSLSWHAIKKIRLSLEAPTPTSLKK